MRDASTERRQKQQSVPDDWERHFNEEQLLAVNKLNQFGWRIKFIRRPLFQDAVIVMMHPDTGEVGILDKFGGIDTATDIVIRD